MKARNQQAVPAAADPMVLLSADSRAELDRWLAKYPADRRRSAVLAGLRIAQNQNGGHLSDELITAVAAYIGIPATQAYEVASFYSLFHTHPCGRHKVSICTNISCWLNGADELVAHVERKLGIGLGESTPDGRIHLIEEEECLAGCVRAPMMWVDGEYHEHLTPEAADRILDALK
jgi:NADH-quinone oxidoreductase subunit E